MGMDYVMPASPAEISDAEIEKSIEKGVSEVIATMAAESVALVGRTPNPPLHSRPLSIEGPHLVASVGFIGDLNGIINTHFDDQVAIEIAAKMLGMSVGEVSSSGVLTDAMGELSNMIVGVFKNTLGEAGYVCKLTLPSIIRGTDFHVDHALHSGRRSIYEFKCRERAIVTDIILELD